MRGTQKPKSETSVKSTTRDSGRFQPRHNIARAATAPRHHFDAVRGVAPPPGVRWAQVSDGHERYTQFRDICGE